MEQEFEKIENGSDIVEGLTEEVQVDPNDKEAVIGSLQKELEEARAKVVDMDDKLKRTIADSMNIRKRLEKQFDEEKQRASAHIISRLLPVLDDLDLAFRNLPANMTDEVTAWVNGSRQIQKKLEMLLEEQSVSKFADAGILDPHRHEAVMSEAHDTIESGYIIDTIRPGYEQRGRILRAALVKVAV